MLKKFIAYQKLLLNSYPPIDINLPAPLKVLLYVFSFAVIIFMNISIFFGNTAIFNSFLPCNLPIIIVWMINGIFHGNHKLFETVPVSRKYTLLNIFLLPIVMIFIMYIIFYISGAVLLCSIFGFIYLTNSQDFSNTPPDSAINQVIDTTKGDLLMLCILVIIVFVGVAIIFIKSRKLRLLSFAGFATIGYCLLAFLKLNMPISSHTGKVEFFESFSIMPLGNTILICVAIATVIISIVSVFTGYNLYVGKSTGSNDC